jgi:peptide/nickel transport system ATP-binding protein
MKRTESAGEGIPVAPVLEVERLDAEIREGPSAQPVLRGAALRIEAGCIHGLVGESGGGKSMLCKAVTGILPRSVHITGGSIRFQGRELLAMRPHERAALLGRGIAMILQNPMTALNPVYKVQAQIVDVLCLHKGLERAAARQRALELLASVHIRDPERVLQLYPHELSGGMCQRVAIAIAFSCEPRLIIADEPTTALDVTVQQRILRLLKEMQQRTGTSVLFVTHDLGIVAKLCDSVSVIYAGRTLFSAPVAKAFDGADRHPYVSALLACAPRYDRPEMQVQPIPGELRMQLLAEARAYDQERKSA